MRNDTRYVISYSDNFSPYYTPITRLIFWIKEIMKKINFSGGEPFLIKNGSNLGLWIIENISIIRTLFGWDGDILQGGPWHRVSQLSAMEVRSRRSGWRSLDTIWTSWPSLLTHLILTSMTRLVADQEPDPVIWRVLQESGTGAPPIMSCSSWTLWSTSTILWRIWLKISGIYVLHR